MHRHLRINVESGYIERSLYTARNKILYPSTSIFRCIFDSCNAVVPNRNFNPPFERYETLKHLNLTLTTIYKIRF